MNLAVVKPSPRWELEPLLTIELVTYGISFSDYLAEIGSLSIFDTTTINDDRDFTVSNGKKTLELVTITGIDSLDFNWPSQLLEFGLKLCSYEVAFELLNKHTNSGLLNGDYYLATERGVFVLGKNPIFLAESWLKRGWLMPKLECRWIFCREISR